MVFPSRQRWLTLSRNDDINPTAVESRANGFAAGLTSHTHSVLVVQRTDEGLGHYLSVPATERGNKGALALAQCVGARMSESDSPPDLSGAARVVSLRYRRDDTTTHATQAGKELAETSRQLATTLGPEEWVAMVVRRPRIFERRWWDTWMRFRTKSNNAVHHSRSKSALVATVYAGGPSMDAARGNLDALVSSLPGFDILTRERQPDRFLAPALALASAIPALVLGAFLAGVVSIATLSDPSQWVLGSLTGALVFAAPSLLLMLALITGLIPTQYHRVRRATRTGRFPAPRSRILWPSKPRKKTFDVNSGSNEKDGDIGGYPLYITNFMLGPTLAAAMIAPQSGGLSASSGTASRHVPVIFSKPIGPMIARTDDGAPVHTSDADAYEGLMIYGTAGGGKSQLLLHRQARTMLERTRPSQCAPGRNGATQGMVSFQTKVEAMIEQVNWANAIGDQVTCVEIANPDSLRIDLFAVPGTVLDRADHFVNLLTYAFPDGNVLYASKRAMRSALAGALVVDKEIASAVAGLPQAASPITYAYILMGTARGDEMGTALANAIRARAERDTLQPHLGKTDAMIAWEALALLHGSGVTPSQRARFAEAPGSKFEQLLTIEHFFSPRRRAIKWSDVLTGHRNVIVNTGRTTSGHMLETENARLVGSMLMFSLRYNIEAHCYGWQHVGKRTKIYADELTELAGNSPDVIAWFKDKGRSYGVEPEFATQNPGQMTALNSTLMSLGTLIAMKQNTTEFTGPLVSDFSAGSSANPWTDDDIVNLPKFHMIVRANVNGDRQPAFVCRAAYWGTSDDVAKFLPQFAADQGFTL